MGSEACMGREACIKRVLTGVLAVVLAAAAPAAMAQSAIAARRVQ